ncbi:mitochondrial pyruvate carrier 1 [Quercus suber]|uniref:Mitochondrial pyruvate carrier n=1 Tax=Quercus suber TaxID=58331 RepID=A0AAW0LZ57_QUESU
MHCNSHFCISCWILELTSAASIWSPSNGRHKQTPESISGNMTTVMCVYSALFMRFAWMVRPRNLHLLALHAANESVQLYQLSRWLKFRGFLGDKSLQQKNEEAET